MALLSDVFSFIGAQKASRAAKDQLNFEREQFAAQQKLSERQIALAEQLNKQGLATQVDASGNVTAYDPITNTWKTVLSAGQQQIQNQSDSEQLQQLGTDATTARNQRQNQAGVRGQEGLAAGSVLDQLRGQISNPAYSGSSLASALRLGRTQAVSQGFDSTQADLARSALRSGGSGLESIGGALAKAKAKAIAQTMGNPIVEGAELADQLNSARINTTGNLYGSLASRAANIDNVAYNPAGIASGQDAVLGNARSIGQQGTAGAATGIGNAARGLASASQLVDYTQHGQAGALEAGIGNLISGYEEQVGSMFGGPSATLLQAVMGRKKAGATGGGNSNYQVGGKGMF